MKLYTGISLVILCLGLVLLCKFLNFEFLFDTNIQVAMEDYEILEDADNGTDVVVKVKLKQYKDYATKILEVKNNADGSQSYTVKQTRPIKK